MALEENTRLEQEGGGLRPEELRAQVGDYIAQCTEADVFPDLAGMRIFLSLSQQEMDSLMNKAPYREIFDYAADCRESWLVRRMCAEKANVSGLYNALKESCNGGYSEKDKGAKSRLVIEFSGNITPEDFL